MDRAGRSVCGQCFYSCVKEEVERSERKSGCGGSGLKVEEWWVVEEGHVMCYVCICI